MTTCAGEGRAHGIGSEASRARPPRRRLQRLPSDDGGVPRDPGGLPMMRPDIDGPEARRGGR